MVCLIMMLRKVKLMRGCFGRQVWAFVPPMLLQFAGYDQ